MVTSMAKRKNSGSKSAVEPDTAGDFAVSFRVATEAAGPGRARTDVRRPVWATPTSRVSNDDGRSDAGYASSQVGQDLRLMLFIHPTGNNMVDAAVTRSRAARAAPWSAAASPTRARERPSIGGTALGLDFR